MQLINTINDAYTVDCLNNGNEVQVYIVETDQGFFYCAKGGNIVNLAPYDVEIDEETDICDLEDVDTFYWSSPIDSIEKMEIAVLAQ